MSTITYDEKSRIKKVSCPGSCTSKGEKKGQKERERGKKIIKEKVVHRAATKGLKKKDGLANEQKKSIARNREV